MRLWTGYQHLINEKVKDIIEISNSKSYSERKIQTGVKLTFDN